jgi:3-oxoacyl-[acyl-carrier-protein] synthase-1
MCCAVGWTAPAARAAIRAGLDRFSESEFFDARGEPIVVARLPIGDVWGPRRLAMMFEAAVAEAATSVDRLDPAATALILMVAESGRPGTSDAWSLECLRACQARFGASFHESSGILPLGRAGIAQALRQAHHLLESGDVRHAIVAGIDSYLNAHTINHFLRRGRLLASDASDGFIPGEGAGALVLASSAWAEAGLHVRGIGLADEAATIDGDVPSRASGLTAAIRGALSQSGYAMSELHFRMADIAGESFFFREAGNALARVLDRPLPHFPLLHITDAVGETGAAVGPLSIAFLSDAMARGHVPGTRALLHFSNDGSARAALVVEHLAA